MSSPAAPPHAPSIDPFATSDGFVGFDRDDPTRPHQDRPYPRQQQRHISDRRPHQPQDRPKTKHEIPGCAPWVLVKTRLRRRFVHNPETGESFWKVPGDLVQGVVEYDVREGKRAEGTLDEYLRAKNVRTEDSEPSPFRDRQEKGAAVGGGGDEDGAVSSDEYEEVEVTDDEEEEANASSDPTTTNKRPRLEPEGEEEDEQPEDRPHEFNEEDMAYQLAQMGQDYALDPDEYGDEYDEDETMANDADEDAEGLPLTAQEATSAFHDALTDHAISPYTTWEHIISTSDESPLLSDPRYTLLTTTKARRAAFDTWSTQRIAQLKALEAEDLKRRTKRHPRVKYLSLLREHATPKLYWPEFKRKYKRDAVMQDRGLGDKEREKLYREYITRVTKKSERERRGDLRELLRSVPVSADWCQGMDVGSVLAEEGKLPEMVVGDIKWAVLGKREREEVLKIFVEDLPIWRDGSIQTAEANGRRHGESKADQALQERQRQVDADKRRQEADLRKGRGELAHGEDELRRAMR